jgi:hypothetical protein
MNLTRIIRISFIPELQPKLSILWTQAMVFRKIDVCPEPLNAALENPNRSTSVYTETVSKNETVSSTIAASTCTALLAGPHLPRPRAVLELGLAIQLLPTVGFQKRLELFQKRLLVFVAVITYEAQKLHAEFIHASSV